jgi:hypothetical protein
MKKPVTKKPKADTELKELAALAARYAVADPGKDARDDFFRRVAKLA